MACKDCRGGGRSGYSLRMSDVRQLYNPTYTTLNLKPGEERMACLPKKCGIPQGYVRSSCMLESQRRNNCGNPCNSFCSWEPEFTCQRIEPAVCDIQPWLKDQEDCDCDDGIGPCVCLDWESRNLGQEERPSIIRKWMQWKEAQPDCACDKKYGCCKRICCPSICECPPYLGKMYGARYMGWAHPRHTMFSRPRVFNYQSLPLC